MKGFGSGGKEEQQRRPPANDTAAAAGLQERTVELCLTASLLRRRYAQGARVLRRQGAGREEDCHQIEACDARWGKARAPSMLLPPSTPITPRADDSETKARMC